ncbi:MULTISPECIES: MarR family winged helix-turn-helix transcriptional regulator [unclassified Granulicatella]|uniref:MarR family winged helix-turn-helix transcriptional regulator n=1 Tax=unclassified Granulicatella TaxID=2630493 RepID=UPI0013D7A42C|nr:MULTISPECIES: winged helix DNA-binding protein [unclassified Granulicatella]MBS4750373.1 winged helix DNA-binding protein [Carnobacteriaceae bacterium zg-ZUI78]QMI85869.1 winged helix DNA-binding protein [Carnobacteriaceae bacterium zg-84]
MPNQHKLIQEMLQTFKRVSKISVFRNTVESLTEMEKCLLMKLYFYEQDHKNPLSIKELSHIFNIRSASIIQFINALENYQYVKREHSTEDKRMTFITLTEVGRQLAVAVYKDDLRIFDTLEKKFGSTISTTLTQLNNILDTLESMPIEHITLSNQERSHTQHDTNLDTR